VNSLSYVLPWRARATPESVQNIKHCLIFIFCCFSVKGGYGELLKKEMQKRKAWLDDHEDRIPETNTDFGNFKDFDEFKVKYDQNKVLLPNINRLILCASSTAVHSMQLIMSNYECVMLTKSFRLNLLINCI
jgi:hypothetical protein